MRYTPANTPTPISRQKPQDGTNFWRILLRARPLLACCLFLPAVALAQTPAPKGFECIEATQSYNNLKTALSARNPLFTKIVGTDFSFTVVALDANGEKYAYPSAGNVTVQLINEGSVGGAACVATGGVATNVGSATITFAATTNQQTVTFSALNNAYDRLRCRVTDSTTNISACSTDTFTVRPRSISSNESTSGIAANADPLNGTSTTNKPIVKAGMPFTLISATGTPGYNGRPKVDVAPAKIEWASAPPQGGAASLIGPGTLNGFNGGVVGNLQFETLADPASGNLAKGRFTYSEVGYFRFKAHAVYDDTYSNDLSKDSDNGDCRTNADGTPVFDNNMVDASGRVSCAFGNLDVSAYFGRFIPDHFTTAWTRWATGQRCPVAPTPPAADNNFIYSKQPFLLTVTARNASGGVTKNYTNGTNPSGTFSKKTTISMWDASNPAATAADTRGALSPLADFAAIDFNAANPLLVVGIPVGGVASKNIFYALVKPETEPANLWVRADEDVVDGDGVTSKDTAGPSGLSFGLYEAKLPMRSGRAMMANTFGPEMLDLNVYFRAEYWYTGAWTTNQDDTCTGNADLNLTGNIPTGITSNANAVSVTLTPGSLPMSSTCVLDSGNPGLSGAGCAGDPLKRFKKGIPSGTSVDFAGDFKLWLQAPGAGNQGNLTVTGNVPQWLWWQGATPKASVNFGARTKPWSYRREVYR